MYFIAMKKLLILAFITSALLGCNSAQKKAENKTVQYYVQIGNSYLEHMRLPQALSTFMQADKISPNNPDVLNGLGVTYLLRKKYALSEKHFLKALSLNPSSTDVRNNMARLYIETGKYNKAIHQLKLAKADLTYQSPDTIRFLYGLMAFKTNKLNKARKLLGSVHLKNPEHCETALYLGQTLYKKSVFDNAHKAYDKAIKSCPKNYQVSLKYFKAMAYAKQNKKLMAETHFNNILFTNPNSSWAIKSQKKLSLLKRQR